ncbi:MAG: glycosyltransferase [Vicinamibacteria bacterium]
MASLLRVRLVINDLRRAGAESQHVLLARGLAAAGHDVALILLKEGNDFEAELAASGLPLVHLRQTGRSDLGLPLRLRRVLLADPSDVVHASLFFANLVTTVALAGKRAPALVLSQRCSYRDGLNPLLRAVAHACHRRAHALIVNSRASAREATAAVPRERVVYVPNGVAKPPGTQEAPSARPPGQLVACVGQLTPEKGHRFLIEAWPEVARRHPDARMVLAGEGPMREVLLARIRALGIQESVVLSGFDPHPGKLLEAADVYVQPSLSEGMPNAVMEAMSLGLPVVATAVGAVPDLIEHGSSGCLVSPADAGALTSALDALLDDVPKRRRLGAAAARRMRSDFSVATMVDATLAVYRRALERAAVPRN